MLNPAERSCFVLCTSCYRCYDRGRYPEICGGCSGRVDPNLNKTPDPDDFCSCREGVLRYRTNRGQLVIRRLGSNPFKGTVKNDSGQTQDERDWDSYLRTQKEIYGEDYDPIQFIDGSSTNAWINDYRNGK